MNTRPWRRLTLGVLALFIVVIANASPLVGTLLSLPLPLDRSVPQPAPLALFAVAVLVLGTMLRHRGGTGRT
jgi:hypothetical protein